MDQIDLLRQLVGILDRLDVPYMQTGTVSTSPRQPTIYLQHGGGQDFSGLDSD